MLRLLIAGGLRPHPPDISTWDTRAPSGWRGSAPAPHTAHSSSAMKISIISDASRSSSKPCMKICDGWAWIGTKGLTLNERAASGSFGPYSQSERRSFYLDAWRKLRDSGLIYPCTCSRKDLERALSAPHEEPCSGAELHPLKIVDSMIVERRRPRLRTKRIFDAAGGGCGPAHGRILASGATAVHPQATTKFPIPAPAAKKSEPRKTTILPQA